MSDYGQEGEDVRLTATQVFSSMSPVDRLVRELEQQFPYVDFSKLNNGDLIAQSENCDRENTVLIPVEWILNRRRDLIEQKLGLFKRAPQTVAEATNWLHANCSFIGTLKGEKGWQAEIEICTGNVLCFIEPNPPALYTDAYSAMLVKAAQSLYAAHETATKSGG